MARNEILLTMEGINTLSCKELKKELTTVVQAEGNISANRWLVAVSFYNIIKGEFFEDDFDSQTDFCEFVNMKKANISQLVNAVDFMYRNHLDFTVYTVGKAYALSTLSDEDFESFMKYCTENDICTHAMSDKKLIELIKSWKASQLEVIEEKDAENEEVDFDINEPVQTSKEDVIANIKKLMEDYNITIDDLK